MNFTNIDGGDFTGMIHGEEKLIPAGKTVPFPQKIAKHFAGQLATKILIREKKTYTEEALRKPLIDQILGGVVAPPEEPAKKEKPKEDLSLSTVKELRKLATEKKVDVKGMKTKKDMIAAIEGGGEEGEFPGVKE